MDCIFCKIINDEVPSNKIYEDEKTLAFLDISQTTEGHCLVIPKKHYKDVHEVNEEDFSFISKTLKKVTNLLKENYNIDNINIISNNGVVAGQTVSHFHFHLIPRRNKDDFSIGFKNNMSKYNNEDLKKIKESIKGKINE